MYCDQRYVIMFFIREVMSEKKPGRERRRIRHNKNQMLAQAKTP
jgi:hypothetical protein